MLTGHSLGGGLGKIVSAKLGIPIVAISAPGVYLRCVKSVCMSMMFAGDDAVFIILWSLGLTHQRSHTNQTTKNTTTQSPYTNTNPPLPNTATKSSTSLGRTSTATRSILWRPKTWSPWSTASAASRCRCSVRSPLPYVCVCAVKSRCRCVVLRFVIKCLVHNAEPPSPHHNPTQMNNRPPRKPFRLPQPGSHFV